jgi:hypothetical protein
MAKNILIKINSVDVTAYVSKYRKTETYGYSVAVVEIDFSQNVNSVEELVNGKTLEVWEDSSSPPTTKVFNGNIDGFVLDKGVIHLTGKDELNQLINLEVTQVYDKDVVGNPAYPDGKISDIFIDIVETYGGLSTNSGATVQDSGTAIVLSKFICNHADPFERCKKLAETLNWVFYYRADTGYVYFEPKNYTTNSNVLTVGSNVLGMPNWEYDDSELINIVRVEGASQLVQTFEVFSGDGAETVFELANSPEDVAVFYSAAKNFGTTARFQSEAKVVDIVGATSTHDVEVDKKRATVTCTSFTPANSTNNLLVEYSYFAPIPVRLKDSASITAYGEREKTITFTDVDSLQDAWKRGENILSKYSEPFKSAKLKVLWTNSLSVRVGQQILVSDEVSVPNVVQYLTIYKVTDYWPEAIVELEVGDKQFTIEEYQANILERVKRLEQGMTSYGDAVTEIEDVVLETTLAPDTTVVKIDLLNDSFTFGHPGDNDDFHAPDEAFMLEDFESYADWTKSGLTQTLSNDSTSGHFWVGSQGVKSAWTDVSGSGYIYSTITSADMSTVTGVSSGTPSQGTIGLWVYCADGSKISQIKLMIGNDSSNYKEYIAQTYAQRNSLVGSFSLQNGLNYLLFDLNNPDATSGSIDWTTIDYARITWTVTGATNMTFDYLTCNESNNIGLNGLGDRVTTFSETTTTY